MKKIKGNKRFILIGFILGAIIFGTTGVLAATYYNSKDVSYDNNSSGMTAENVQDAIDELYSLANAIDIADTKIPTVTSGDGLYADAYEDNIYTYRGSNPNNYITFNGETWRIISINISENTIKIIRNNILSDMAYDTSNNGRYKSGQYCNSDRCNIYGSINSLYNINGSKITSLARPVNGTKYQLPSKESEISTYLNNTYYNTILDSPARNMIVDGNYKAALMDSTAFSNENIKTQISYSNEAIWKGKVGILNATEYLRASIGSNVKSNNWLYIQDIYWTMSPRSINYSNLVWVVHSDGDLWYLDSKENYGVRPVVTLSPEVKITSGNGSSSSPYQLTL